MARPNTLIYVFALLAGCTVSPAVVAPPAAPSFSGNVQNGGVIDLGPGGKGPAHVTLEWVQTYAALCRKYGQDMTPPDRPGDGLMRLPDGTYEVDLQHLADNNVMATMERSGILP
jgi:hypothetical protein